MGVRELRQNLSVYLRQVKKGARLEVTEYGHPVALLAPLPRNHSWVERMIAEGQATRPEGDLLDLGPALPRKPGEPSLNHFLDELREDRV
ncbi:MAG: type II toxin-antitoxin system Phd/YefM family antitoxin [Streptosporangiaceae bacterium]